MHIAFTCLIITILLGSCKSKRALVADRPIKSLDTKKLLHKIYQSNIQCDWMVAKAKMDYEDNNMSIGFSSNMVLRRDSVVWMNFTKFGFEAARVLITKDTICILNRVDKTYVKENLNYFNEKYKVALDFEIIQQILLGNFISRSEKGITSSSDSTHYKLMMKNATDELFFSIFPQNFRPASMKLSQDDQGRSLNIILDDYRMLDEKHFSYERDINTSGESEKYTIDLQIRFTEVIFDAPKKFKFDIPSRYTRLSY